MTHAGKKLHLIPLDLHTAAAAITALTAPEFVIDEVEVDGEVGGDALQQRYQGLTVRLPGSSKAEHDASITQVRRGF
jgi:hypothetical protein